MYEANLVRVSKRSKFKVYANASKPDTKQKLMFVEKCGSSSQNQYRMTNSEFTKSGLIKR